VEAAVLATGAEDTVGTCGLVQLSPGAVNSVPRGGHLEIDIRDIDGARRDQVVQRVLAAAEEIATRRGVRLASKMLNSDPPSTSDPVILDAIEEAAQRLSLPSMRMVSRAYHDTLFMAHLTGTAMIFIPCLGGFSHRPDEFSSEEDIANGVRVLALTLARLAQ
jgi:ureidoglycolate amidohydrolase